MSALAWRQWLNIGLLGLAGGLLLMVLLDAGPQLPPEVSALLNLAPTQINRIVAVRLNQEPLVFERRADGWWMIARMAGLANPVLLDPILRLPGARCPLSYSADGIDLAALQLDPPQLRLWLEDREIRFGTTAPTDGQRYLQIGRVVYLCPDAIYPLLTSAAESFIAPSIETLLKTGRQR